jgi:hypothetical protein
MIQYCQILGNLCVLQLYDKSAGACAAFNSIAQTRGSLSIYGELNWKVSNRYSPIMF